MEEWKVALEATQLLVPALGPVPSEQSLPVQVPEVALYLPAEQPGAKALPVEQTSIHLFLLVLLCLFRVTTGPTILNRAAGISAVGTKTLIILLIIGVIHRRVEMFVDISMVYALLNFIGCLVLAKYLERMGEV